MKIVTIVGARPQFIKAAALSREIAKYDDIEEVIVHTGQHYDNNMSAVFFEEMQIPLPHYNLDVNGLGHGAMTGQMLEKIETVLTKEKPDWVLVYGDTNSTIAGALAAKKMHIKVAHVEAGLRSFNMKMPEEINRILTDRISDILFCSTDTAVENLRNEGFENIDCKIVQSGDIMLDTALFYAQRATPPDFDVPEKFILTTVHRAENTDDFERLTNIFEALNEISKEIPVVLPLHPRTQNRLEQHNVQYDNIIFIKPIGYLSMVWLLDRCQLVMTDSGGLQKEAFFFKKYCVILRDETEWVELVQHNYSQLVGAAKDKIIHAFRYAPKGLSFDKNLYGKGDTSTQIISELREV